MEFGADRFVAQRQPAPRMHLTYWFVVMYWCGEVGDLENSMKLCFHEAPDNTHLARAL